tara:strand:- start:73 stop:246 length:174 start_codon:yes stop_codon:yes gene_type:complete
LVTGFLWFEKSASGVVLRIIISWSATLLVLESLTAFTTFVLFIALHANISIFLDHVT